MAIGLLPQLDHLAVLISLALLFFKIGLANDAHCDDEADDGQDDLVALKVHGLLLAGWLTCSQLV